MKLFLTFTFLMLLHMMACDTTQNTTTTMNTPTTTTPTQQTPPKTETKKSAELPTRDQIDEKYKWDLTELFLTNEAWEKEFKSVDAEIANYKQFEGTLGTSAAALLDCLSFSDDLERRLDKLDLYASLSKDLDVTDGTYQSMADRVTNLISELLATSSFIEPEILQIPQERVNEFLSIKKELQIYKHYLDDLFRTKEHTLTPDQEKLLALAEPMGQAFKDIYDLFTNGDLSFPTIKDENGQDKKVTVGSFFANMMNTNRDYRERFYRAFFIPYTQFHDTLGALYNGSIKKRLFEMEARKYTSILKMRLDENNIPEDVFKALVATTNKNLSSLHRWARIKKEALGLNELHPYDTFVTLFPAQKKTYTFEEAKDLVLKALEPFGQDYIASLKKAFDNRLIDVHETRGKKSGAYNSGSVKGAHSYVLLNWNGDLNDVMTLAHELGHNMHSFYTEQSQPYVYASYSVFLAEIASTANEILMAKYLIDHAQTAEEKLSIINEQLTTIQQSFFRQTRFAEFEHTVLSRSEKGEVLTADQLAKIFGDFYKKYWGPVVVVDKEEAVSWTRIPHFYRHYYVYQYATGLSASYALVDGILKEGQPAVERYLEFLKAGSSDYPIEVLKKAGVDMTQPQPILAVVKRMNALMDELEKTKK